MLLLTSTDFDQHVTPPGHPERPERAHVFDAVASQWRDNGGRILLPRPVSREELERVHDPAYLDRIAASDGHAVMLDPDTFTSPDSLRVAQLAAGMTRPLASSVAWRRRRALSSAPGTWSRAW